MSYVVRQKAGGGRIYLYLADNHHVSEICQARQDRKYLGVLEQESGELLLALGKPEPSQELLELLAKAGVGYSGKRSPPRGRKPSTAGTLRILEAEGKTAWVEELGEAYVMCILARESGLEAALTGALGETDGPGVLWAAMHQACTAEQQYLACEWLDDRRLPKALSEFDFSSAGLSALSEALGRSHTCRHRFLQNWIKACGRPEAIILDTTSLSTYSDNLDTAEWGHNRDEESLPQVNFSLAIDAVEHRPLAYRVNFGSVPDVATLQATSVFLNEFGLSRITYSADKGFWSNANAAGMIGGKLKFVMGIPQISVQAKALVEKHRGELDAPKNSLLHNGHVVRHSCDKWLVKMPDDTTIELNTFLFMEPERVADRILDLERRTLGIEHIASKIKFKSRLSASRWLTENAKGLAKYFHVTGRKGKLRINRDNNAVAKTCSVGGVSIYATNCAKLKEDAILSIVRGRDAVEKVFDLIKNEDGQKRLRTGNDDRVEGRMFLAFVAAILRILLENRMREAGLLKNRTVTEALALLRKIKKIHFESGKCLVLDIPKRTRKLLEAMKMALPD